MTRWRIALALLLGLLAVPLVWPAGELLWQVEGGPSPRLLGLAKNTAVLAAGTLALALPLGVLAAVLLERTDLPGRGFLHAVLVCGLFIPLPLWLSGWQAVAGVGGLLPWSAWQAGEWAPWASSIGAAVWVHALAGLPWVVLIVGLGLRRVEPELEEDALLVRPAAWVIWRVTLPRSAAAIGAAALWLTLQTLGEITVTDLMQVRTFAEEVYTQLSLDAEGVSPAVAPSLLVVVLAVGGVVMLARQAERFIPAGEVSLGQRVCMNLGVWRWPAGVLVGGVILALLLIPVLGLAWRAGVFGTSSWSALTLARQVARAARDDRWLLCRSLAVAGFSGVLCAALALVGCWLARESRWLGGLLLAVLAAAWAMPGPVLGLGLKDVFLFLVDASAGVSSLPARLLWYGPSPFPLIAVYVVRFLPCAAALLWPLVRQMPDGLLEASRLDGARPGMELSAIVWPLMMPAFWRAALVAAILSLGELSAGKLVSTPGAESYAEAAWTQMHYGVTAELAARCLVLLTVVLVAALGLGVGWSRYSGSETAAPSSALRATASVNSM